MTNSYLKEFDVGTRLSFYGRVSTDKNDQKNSLENQRAFFDRVYVKSGKYIIKEEWLYFDPGITGTKLKRPKFDKMLYDAGLDIIEVRNKDNDNRKEFMDYVTIPSSTREPLFDIIIVKNTSRFARNINAFKILQQLRQKKVYVYFIDKNKCTENEEDIESIQKDLLAAEGESREKSRMVTFGAIESAEAGIIRTGGNPLGYKFIKEENRLEIVEEEAEMIRKIFQWYLEGNGIKRIIKKLTENGYYNRKGKVFTINTIRRVLQNERYLGWSVRNKLDAGKVFNKNTYYKIKPKEEWIIKKDTGKIPQIISEEDFFKVQEMWQNNVNYKINKGKYMGVSEFASKIYCGKCGAVYHKNVNKGRHLYNCSNKRKYGTEKCNNKNLYVTQIEEMIKPEKYREELYNINVLYGRELSVLAYKLSQRLNATDQEKVESLNLQLKELNERRQRILNMYEMNYINDKELQQKMGPINKEIKNVEEEIYQYSKNNEEILKDLQELQETTQKLKIEHFILTNQSEADFAKEHTREDIVNDIKKIVVNEDGTADIYYKTFDKYYELREKHKDLLDIYVKEGEVEKFIEESNKRIEEYKNSKYENMEIIKRA